MLVMLSTRTFNLGIYLGVQLKKVSGNILGLSLMADMSMKQHLYRKNLGNPKCQTP